MVITLGNYKGVFSKTTSVALLGTIFSSYTNMIVLDADNEPSLINTDLLYFEVRSATMENLREQVTKLNKQRFKPGD